MRKLFAFALFTGLIGMTSLGQVSQFPQVYNNDMGDPGASNLNIRQTASSSGNILISGGFGIGSKIGCASLASNNSDPYFYNWVQVCLPSTNGALTYGYIACDEFYARIDPTNNYATVTATSLNIRPSAGSSSWVTIGGQNAMYGQNSIVALTGTTSVVSGTTWYQVYLTRNCSQTTGWLSGAFLTINGTTSNYRTVGGRVCNDASSCNFLGNLNGATINISGIGTTNSSGGFYQYKLPTNYSCTITCSYPGYNTSTPSSWPHTANSHNYTRNFVMSNTCPIPSSPTNLVVISTSPTSVTLSWSPVSGSGITYEILKNNTSCGFPFGSSGFTTTGTTITLTGLTPNTPYYFTVIATNSCGSSGNSNCVFAPTPPLTSPPIANFTANKSVVLINEQVQFIDLSLNNPTSWSWEFARESSLGNFAVTGTSNQPNPLITFNPSGSYRVRLTVINSAGSNTITRTSFIYVKSDPTSSIPAAAAQSIQNYTYYGGDPVNAAQGIFTFSQTDLATSGRKTKVTINRLYTSSPNGISAFGTGWYCEYDKWMIPGEWQSRLFKGDGSYVDFTMYTNGKMESNVPALHDSMSYTLNAGIFTFTYYDRDGIKWMFNNGGYLISKIDLDGNTTQIIRNGAAIDKIIAPGGRELNFTYGSGFFSVTNSIDTAYYYVNSNTGLLDSVRIRGSRTWYKYNANNKLEEIISPNNTRIIKNEYTNDQVTRQWDAYDNVTQMQFNTPSSGYTTIINAAGKSRVVKHDASFQITDIKNEQNNTKRFVQTPDHQVDSLIDENNNGYKFYNTPDGHVYKSVDPLLNSDSTGYTSFGKPVYQKDKEGNQTTIGYSTTLNPTTITLANSGVIQIQYDQFGQDTATTDQLNHKTRKSYNTFGDPIKISKYYSSDSLIYDAIGRPVIHINGRGYTDSIQYNHYGQPVRLVDQMGNTQLFSYDPNGNLISSTDKDGIVTNFYYDAKDRLIRIVKAGVTIKEFVWDVMDYLVRVRDANKNCKIITNDELGRPIIVADSVLGVLAQYSYDAAGNQVLYKNSLGQPWTTRFDKLNQPVGVKNPSGDSTITIRNKNGLPIEDINELGKSTKYSYNSINVLVRTIGKNLDTVLIFPNTKGLPDSIRDARRFYRRMTYDEDDRPKTYDEGYGLHQFFYDAANNQTKHITATGSIIEHDFNPRNESINEKWNGTIIKQFGYTNAGVMNYAWTPTNSLYKYFNNLGFLIKDSATFGGATLYQPDSVGNNKGVTLSDGKHITYTFNSINVNTSLTDWANRTFQINRDNDGGATAYIYPNNFRTDIGRNAAYQVNNWINSRTVPSNTVIQANKFVLSKRSEIIADTSAVNFYPANTTGPSSITGTYGPADRRLTYGPLSLTNDANGNIIGVTGPGVNNAYTFNPDNSVATINHYGTQSNFTHNAFGNRVAKTTGANITRYNLSNAFAGYPVVLQELDGTNNVKATNLFTADGVLLGRDSAGVFTFIHHNALGNTSFLTDANGTVTNTYAYALFGNYQKQTGTSTQPYTWQGMYGIQKEGKDLYYPWARLYDANIGSFIGPDPVQGSLTETRSLNPYLYGLNDPASYRDPNGLYPQGTNNLGLNWFERFAVSNAGLTTIKILNGIVTGATVGVGAITTYLGMPQVGTAYAGGIALITNDPNRIAGFVVSATLPSLNIGGIRNGQPSLINQSIPKILNGSYTTTNTVANNIATRPYINSPITITNIMKSGNGIPDPFFEGGVNFKSMGTFNGSNGVFELGINPQTNVIYHFVFKSIK